MMSGRILTALWPFLKLLQIMGGCPLAKDDSNSCGFKALSSVAYFVIIICVCIVAASMKFGFFLLFTLHSWFECVSVDEIL